MVRRRQRPLGKAARAASCCLVIGAIGIGLLEFGPEVQAATAPGTLEVRRQPGRRQKELGRNG